MNLMLTSDHKFWLTATFVLVWDRKISEFTFERHILVINWFEPLPTSWSLVDHSDQSVGAMTNVMIISFAALATKIWRRPSVPSVPIEKRSSELKHTVGNQKWHTDETHGIETHRKWQKNTVRKKKLLTYAKHRFETNQVKTLLSRIDKTHQSQDQDQGFGWCWQLKMMPTHLFPKKPSYLPTLFSCNPYFSQRSGVTIEACLAVHNDWWVLSNYIQEW